MCVVASDLTNQLPNAPVPANESVSNHRVMYLMMQNVACFYEIGINVRLILNIFIRVHVKSLNVVVYELCHEETCLHHCIA